MEETTKVYEVKRKITRKTTDEKTHRFILERVDGVWQLRTPEASVWTTEALEQATNTLKELNKED